MVKMAEWQAIDTAPRDGTDILLYWPSFYCPTYGDDGSHPFVGIGRWKTNSRLTGHSADSLRESDLDGGSDSYFSDTWRMDDYGLSLPGSAPTHWQPIPSPPI